MNRLAGQTSRYLRQHADNPVDWFPWGEEAFASARELDRPLFVSIGYSACHWCHVMAHESFEDEATAQVLNRSFVAVKVDREERPDVDAIYMEAAQATTGSGGWPLSIFAAPDGRPFFAGTYFPKVSRGSYPSFVAVLEAVADAWATRREELQAQADELTSAVATRLSPTVGGASPRRALGLRTSALERFAALFDPQFGGVERAPKFPQPPMLELVLRAAAKGDHAASTMLDTTLAAMAAGGIYDHLGGGFARYAVDRQWLVPHFEKMLYDQAGLTRLYLHTYQATGDERWERVVRETIAYVGRDLALGGGAYASSEDADTDGVEGRFSTWTPGEIVEVLGDGPAEAVCRAYGITETGHLEDGRSVLHRSPEEAHRPDAALDAAREALFTARERRSRPGLDDKALTEWNAMWCAALAEVAFVFDDEALRDEAVAAGAFLLEGPRRADGRWLRSYQAGKGAHLAVAADYAWLVECFTRLAQCTGASRFVDCALEAASGLIELFSAEDGGWYTTGADAQPLVVRARDAYDGVTPSASSVAAVALARLGVLTGETRLQERASATVEALSGALEAGPLVLSHLLSAVDLLENGAIEVVVAGTHPELLDRLRRGYHPDVVLAWGEPTGGPLWEGRRPEDGGDGAYVCHDGVCEAPALEPSALDAALSTAEATRRAT